jgi:hypothetical protein
MEGEEDLSWMWRGGGTFERLGDMGEQMEQKVENGKILYWPKAGSWVGVFLTTIVWGHQIPDSSASEGGTLATLQGASRSSALDWGCIIAPPIHPPQPYSKASGFLDWIAAGFPWVHGSIQLLMM